VAELMHGYTYSAHPLACAAAMATLDALEADDLLARSRSLAPHLERAVHALASTPGVVSVRNIGLAAGVELAPYGPEQGGVGARGAAAQAAAFHHGVLTRAPGDTLIVAPPFISEAADIDRMVERLQQAITSTTVSTTINATLRNA
jgi:beta-alanine--pyruvate transaminase